MFIKKILSLLSIISICQNCHAESHSKCDSQYSYEQEMDQSRKREAQNRKYLNHDLNYIRKFEDIKRFSRVPLGRNVQDFVMKIIKNNSSLQNNEILEKALKANKHFELFKEYYKTTARKNPVLKQVVVILNPKYAYSLIRMIIFDSYKDGELLSMKDIMYYFLAMNISTFKEEIVEKLSSFIKTL